MRRPLASKIWFLAFTLGCAKGPSPGSPIAQAETARPAPGQTKLTQQICASAAYIDEQRRRAYLWFTGTRSHGSPLVSALYEPAHKAAVLAGADDGQQAFVDEFLVRTDFMATGRVDGERIQLTADNLSLTVNRVPGVSTPFFVGTVGLVNESSVQFSCWTEAAKGDYTYNGATGKCVDPTGETGHNRWTLAYVRDTNDGECTALGHVQLNEENFTYPTFSWNLKGADLSNADMVFSNFKGAQFEGANLVGLTIGYTSIEGTKDVHTQLPDETCRELSPTTFSCSQ